MDKQNAPDAAKNPLSRIKIISSHAVAGIPLEFACPVCGKTLKHSSSRPGNALLRCASCKTPLLLRIDPQTPGQQQNGTDTPPGRITQPPRPKIPLLGPAVPNADGSYSVKEKAIIGNSTSIKCGHCGKLHAFTPQTAGRKSLNCVKCKAVIRFEVIDPAAPQVKVATAKAPARQAKEQAPRITVALRGDDSCQTMGAISYGGFMGMGRKEVRLRPGENTIGRTDKDKPSSISFNDQFMSRQSIMIDVQEGNDKNSGYLFQLRVLNAANPVYINKQAYRVGESVYLNYGDTIRLGRTTMRFVQAKNK